MMYGKDAGELRQELVHELVNWRAAGMIPHHKSKRWWRRARILASLVAVSLETVYKDLEADAEIVEGGSA